MKTQTLTADRIFALRGYTIRTDRGRFYIGQTACFDDKQKWHGPYKSLQHATTAIARKLQAEYVARDARLASFPSKKRRASK